MKGSLGNRKDQGRNLKPAPPFFPDTSLNQPALLQVICIDADGGFRKLATLLEQPFDVLAEKVRFKEPNDRSTT